jgi:hypothetical protein
MSKAERRALELYPIESGEVFDANGDIYESGDKNYAERFAYIKGYHQAEKDLELGWEDIADILDVTDVIANDDSMEELLKTMSEEEYCQEVLKRYKERKEK